jgi:hypothetical protein
MHLMAARHLFNPSNLADHVFDDIKDAFARSEMHHSGTRLNVLHDVGGGSH